MTKYETLQELLKLLPIINEIFDSESAVLKLNDDPIIIVGDIHGNLAALNTIISQRNREKMLFLGDYIDRGEQGVEVLHTLFKLKIAEPNNIYLLRGNHEDEAMNRHYGFFDEISRNHCAIELLQQTFEKMPIAATVNDSLFCVHGGIPGMSMIDTITKQNSFEYLWNDPSNREGLHPSNRGFGIFNFGPDVVKGFLEINKLNMIIRSHTAVSSGYAVLFDGRLISIFSCPGYSDANDGAYIVYNNDTIHLHLLKNTEESK
jgi:serine/threonine-protein phosphatase PP1 catalytic subunit